jgi:NAD(P)-dependent dehydrogenase (short-subunit alcohol dehydrogenase family)
MDLGLQDRVVIVTGGAKGIGRAITHLLIEEGAVPVIADKDQEAVDAAKTDFEPAGLDLLGIVGDLVEPSICERVIEATVERHGRIDGLVNNAGINDKVGLETGTPRAFMESIERNLLHVYCMAHYALPYLKKTGGPIVNISSKTAVTGQGNTSGYIAAKGGVLGLTREWAVDLAAYGIRVNAVLPAEVWTPLYEYWVSTFKDPEGKRREMESQIPLGRRMTSPEEIASMVVYLLSRQASHITGQHLHVDGGYVHLDRMMTSTGQNAD